MRSPHGKRRLLAALGLFALLAAACASDAPQDFLNNQSGPRAEKADDLWDITFAIAVAVFVIVEGLIVFALFRFRHRPGREAKQFHGNTRVEIALTVVPALILAGLAVPTVDTIFDLDRRPDDALEITVVGRQFWWEYRYPEQDIVTANEMHIPVDRPVFLSIEGASDDVIHSFWVPRLGGTQDVVPGRTNTLILEADEPGRFLGQCKEFCGLSHANMRLVVQADPPDEFDRWVAEQQQPAQEELSGQEAVGRDTFLQSACVGCHTIEGTEASARIGPDLTHLASRETFAAGMFELNEQNLRRWVADAPSEKPGVLMPSGVDEMGLNQEDVDAIVAYLLSLE